MALYLVNVNGFVVLPKRWIVEPTFAWIGKGIRKNTKKYDVNGYKTVLVRNSALSLTLAGNS